VFNDVEIDLGKFERLSMREAIIKWWPEELSVKPTLDSFNNPESLDRVLAPAHQLLKELQAADEAAHPQNLSIEQEEVEQEEVEREAANIIRLASRAIAISLFAIARFNISKAEPIGKIIAELFEGLAESHLVQPTIIYEFPTAISPLSKQDPRNPDFVERFEVYCGGFEIGNAFSELNDPVEQHKRFEQQLAERFRGDEEAHQMDEDYVRALMYGLPPTGGEGIGIDRLTMVLTGAKSIRDVILFPLLRNRDQRSENRDQEDGEGR
jgi:lysyl-tRNA synthetase class 2